MSRKVPKEKVDKIFEAHKQGMTLAEAARYAQAAPSTVELYWLRAGLEVVRRECREISDEQKAKILEAHSKGMSTGEAARYAGCSDTAVSRYWDKAGLKPNFEPGQLVLPQELIDKRRQSGLPVDFNQQSQEKVDKISEAHKLGMTLNEAAEHAGVSIGTVQKCWRKAGLKANLKSDLPQEKIDKIYGAYELGWGAKKAAKYAEVSLETVKKYWKDAGLEPRLNQSTISIEKEARIYRAYGEGLNLSEAAEYAGVGIATVKKYWDKIDPEKFVKPHGPPRKLTLEVLLDKVFDANNPDEALSFREIRTRLLTSNYRFETEDLVAKLDFLVDTNIYKTVRIEGVRKYSKSGEQK